MMKLLCYIYIYDDYGMPTILSNDVWIELPL